MLRTWIPDDFPTLANEKAIWANWNLPLQQGKPSQAYSESSKEKKDTWIPPQKHTIKLNFDGASKGNPRNAGYGAIFRNHAGSPLLIYYGNIGWDTNNSAELERLWQGLLLSRLHNFQPLEIEGDSLILINMAKQNINGIHARKIAKSWRLEARLEVLKQWLHNNQAIIFPHVKREGNKVADVLSNLGVDSKHTLITGVLDIIQNHNHAQECKIHVEKEDTPPYAGDCNES